MSWQRGRRRHTLNATRFIAALCAEYTAADLSRLCGVSDRTVRRWRDGVDHPSPESLHRLIDSLFPLNRASGPIYSPEMALDGNTWVGGVGQYTVRAARGESLTEEEGESCLD
jgi:hypothetical protein